MAIPSATISMGPKMVNGRPRIHSAEARKARASPWAKVIIIAIHVQGRLDHSKGVEIPASDSSKIPTAIPATTGERISMT